MIRQALALLMVAGCGHGSPDASQPPPVTTGIRLAEVARGFSQPLYVTAPAGDARLFVVEQTGRVRIVRNGHVLATPFIDLSAKITSGGDPVLISLDLHTQHATNSSIYVDYTDLDGDTRVERYHVSTDPDVADPASAQLVLAQPQPYANHNGGELAFGPSVLCTVLTDGPG